MDGPGDALFGASWEHFREVSMKDIAVVGLDTSKSWFQVHGCDASGNPVLRVKVPRTKLLSFFAKLAPCLIGMEACGGAHHWARELSKIGHTVRLMPARYVKPYVKSNKNDAADAEACCEAVQRPNMRWVPIKSVAQQSLLMLHRVRDLMVRQRTASINALRGHLAEFGISAARGKATAKALMSMVSSSTELQAPARQALLPLVRQIEEVELRIADLDHEILAVAKDQDVCRRLMTIPGVGPFIATALAASVSDPQTFSSGRHLAAWLGLVPRQYSTGGKPTLGRISKRGDGYIRKLLIHGARATIARARRKPKPGAWITGVLARRPFNVAAVALANKTARIAWAIMVGGEVYQPAP
jgi:transposase